MGNLNEPFNFLIRSRKQPYEKDKVAQAALYNTTGYERSETETRTMEIFTRFLGASAMKACFQLPSDDGSSYKFSVADIKFIQ